MCWLNADSSTGELQQCLGAWTNYLSTLNLYNPTIQELVDQEKVFWGNLGYDEFAGLWNDNVARRPPSSDPGGYVMMSGAAIVLPISMLDTPIPGPMDFLAGIGLACVAGLALVAGTTAITLSTRPTYAFTPTVYSLAGFDKKLGTLAEHLAKLLEREVAGYSITGTNPNRDPDGGWCVTVKRVIKEIDKEGLSEKQLNRDIQATSIGNAGWAEIISAVKEVIALGLCDDHWGDFSGGSFAR
jgi:hypothetical protein